MVNDNNPELIKDEGILLSTFPSTDGAGLDVELKGRFDLFSHHVYAGDDDSLESTLWLAVLAPLGEHPVDLKLLEGSTSLSQAHATRPDRCPFSASANLIRETSDVIAAGPGSRVAGDLLKRRRATELSTSSWRLQPGAPTTLLVLPIPVAGLDPLLNGRNLQLRLHSSGPIALATLAAYGGPTRLPHRRSLD